MVKGECKEENPPYSSSSSLSSQLMKEEPSILTRRRRRRTTSPPPPPPRKIIRLTKQPKKTIVKSPMFMTSPSSIYAAVCKYDSLVDALHGGGGGEGAEEDGDVDCSDCSRRGGLEGKGRRGSDEEERSLVLICIYFGGCPIFEREFDSILLSTSAGVAAETNDSPLYPAAYVEEALHRSVRHLCDDECFLRAYHPIREFTFLWRDILIDETDGNDKSGVFSSPPNGRRRLTKENLLSGWSCRLCPTISYSVAEEGGSKKRAKGRSMAVVFVSPDGIELNTKAKVIKHMNELLSSTQRPTPMSFTQGVNINDSPALIDITAAINPLYSPLGLLEELFLDDPWKLLVSTICLNVTTRSQVDAVLHRFLQKWPDAASTRKADWEEISKVVTPLGLGIKRAKGLIRFSREYLDLTGEFDAFSLTEGQVRGLYNVGQYGWTAYKVFILNRLPSGSVKVCDHALQLYVEYQLGRRAMVRRKLPSIDWGGGF
jgi:hypothetical protein